jgi:hypothetical protein
MEIGGIPMNNALTESEKNRIAKLFGQGFKKADIARIVKRGTTVIDEVLGTSKAGRVLETGHRQPKGRKSR